MIELGNIKDFKQAEFTIKDVKFRVDKMNAMAGFKVLESIRHEIATTKSTDKPLNIKDKENIASDAIKSVLSLNPEFIDDLRLKLFKNTKFKGNGAQSYMDLLDAEDMAFQNLEPVAIYEVIARALAVNFIGSFTALMSKLQAPA